MRLYNYIYLHITEVLCLRISSSINAIYFPLTPVIENINEETECCGPITFHVMPDGIVMKKERLEGAR